MLDRLYTLPTGVMVALLACLVCGAAGTGVGYGMGYRYAAATGSAELERERTAHAEAIAMAAHESRITLRQQVTRANAAESQLLADQAGHAKQVTELEGRIGHVTSHYRPSPAQAPQPAPRCVFTVGWLRDYNAALGVPGALAGPVTGPAGPAPWAAPGTDAELLESGVTPADILAHAQDYGRWARGLASQVTGLLSAREVATP